MASIFDIQISQAESWDDSDFPDDLPTAKPRPLSSQVEEDWDFEMDLGTTGGAKVPTIGRAFGTAESSQMITIRPPISIDDLDAEDEGDLSTIKAGSTIKGAQSTSEPFPDFDDDMEMDLDMPASLIKLSLPLSTNRRVSKGSVEWGERDQTSSSQSSDAYSSLFPEPTPSSSSASSVSQPRTESEYGSDNGLVASSAPVTDTEEDDWDLDGLEIPDVFESTQAGLQMRRMLETKKKIPISPRRGKSSRVPTEDDFEDGLVIDQGDLSPSKLRKRVEAKSLRMSDRSRIAANRVSSRPSSRTQPERAKSPVKRPPSSARQFIHGNLPPTPPSPPKRSSARTNESSVVSSYAVAKPGALRSQKSQIILKPAEPSKLTRKGSLSSLIDVNQASGLLTQSSSTKPAGYDAPTLASRAKLQSGTTRQAISSVRPLTPSSNVSSVRLTTMPTLTRTKSRPTLTSLFPSPAPGASSSRAISPLPPIPARPPSRVAQSGQPLPKPSAIVPREMRKPKRQYPVADPSALDSIDDLPVDAQKERRFRVQPKNHVNRIPGGSYGSSVAAPRKKTTPPSPESPRTYKISSIKRTGTIAFPNKSPIQDPKPPRKTKGTPSPVQANSRRKPTLIRHLGPAPSQKVVGDMKWNPKTLRWEGNEQVLSAFDAPITKSVRPALITQLTGSVMGSPTCRSTPGARKVGNMIFDPSRMCWISDAQEDEIDIFADFADDENDWDGRGSTIRTSSVTAPSPAPTHERTISESSSDRGSRASLVYDVDSAFLERCHAAEARHLAETRAWRFTTPGQIGTDHRSHLYDIRALATRQY